MAYKLPTSNFSTEFQTETTKENWRRSLHILNMFTIGQYIAFQGECNQNPWQIVEGCTLMLENIATQFQEQKSSKVVDEKTGKEKSVLIVYKGLETLKYQECYAMLAEAKQLINYWMNNRNISNANQILSRAYQILHVLKMTILQTASEFGMDFETKKDPNNAWLHG